MPNVSSNSSACTLFYLLFILFVMLRFSVDSSLEDLRLRLMRSGVSYVYHHQSATRSEYSTVVLFFSCFIQPGAFWMYLRTHIHRVSKIRTEYEIWARWCSLKFYFHPNMQCLNMLAVLTTLLESLAA